MPLRWWPPLTRDVRKLEPNKICPADLGIDTFAQASILNLYDPARSKKFLGKEPLQKGLRRFSKSLPLKEIHFRGYRR